MNDHRARWLALYALCLGDQAQPLLGHDAAYYVVPALAWTIGLVVVFGSLAVAKFRRS